MAKRIYNVDKKQPTMEDIYRLSEEEGVFFRFHDPERRMSSRSKSWGMIYTSEAEARREYKDMGLDSDDAILNGKSCMPTMAELMHWWSEFDSSYVIVAFEGVDTRETGHDGEYVATYTKKRAVWNIDYVCKMLQNNGIENLEDWENWKENNNL